MGCCDYGNDHSEFLDQLRSFTASGNVAASILNKQLHSRKGVVLQLGVWAKV
jgi:hypothetical protein